MEASDLMFTQMLQAAEKGNADAQNRLAGMYLSGTEESKNYEQAVVWLLKAAEQGHTKAQFNLGIMYAAGKGVAQDFKLAYAWGSVAAINGGDSNAAHFRDAIAHEIFTPATLADAQALAEQLTMKHRQY
ncbi:tetratricopeptide repeat protein [Aeromonas media]|uniref:tetratricopeptide repeat protein n=1 Tax=Aeromonas media TaxID=651 RepID=UPI002953D418|nr:tetratricopeptide repeat protein [Aeromonas media]WOQ13814.1 tetratricopeptide repeat protein [Aeromonas media]